MKRILALFLTLIALLMLSACSTKGTTDNTEGTAGDPSTDILGGWHHSREDGDPESVYLWFYSDGTYDAIYNMGQYSIVDGKLKLSSSDGQIIMLDFTVNLDELVLKNFWGRGKDCVL